MTTIRPDRPSAVREFDHHSCPGITTDPFTAFDRFRDEPIFWTSAFGGFWVLTRFADIRAVLCDAVAFSSRHTAIPAAGWTRPLIPEELDPPDHGKYRALVTRCLAGASGDMITAALDQECVELVRRLAPRGACDLVADYSLPLQHTLFTSVFAVPREDAAPCARWVADLLQHRDLPLRLRAMHTIKNYLAQRIAERPTAAMATTGLLDALARADLDGRPLTSAEILDIAFLMVMASLDTMATSLSFSFHYLAQHPTNQNLLATTPGLTNRAAEELLRLHSVVGVARTATRDTTLAGTRISGGDRVLLCLSLADRDPETYPNPTTADFDRSVVPGHLAFGAGPHRCLGARIAGQGLTAALRAWHDHIPAYTITRHAEISTGGGSVCSLDALPLTWPI